MGNSEVGHLNIGAGRIVWQELARINKAMRERVPFETLVQSTPRGRSVHTTLAPEWAAIVDLCQSPISVAEISAHLHIHLGVARVLVGDMEHSELISISAPITNDNGPDTTHLERLLHELEAL